jgi:hypothetical protein
MSGRRGANLRARAGIRARRSLLLQPTMQRVNPPRCRRLIVEASAMTTLSAGWRASLYRRIRGTNLAERRPVRFCPSREAPSRAFTSRCFPSTEGSTIPAATPLDARTLRNTVSSPAPCRSSRSLKVAGGAQFVLLLHQPVSYDGTLEATTS